MAIHESVQVNALAEELGVSTETIRRDLDRLDKEGRLRKVYGGAVRVSADVQEPPYAQRSEMNHREKLAICEKAASLVLPGETIMLGSGTTTIHILRYLQNRPDVTIVTHDFPIAALALDIFPGKLVFAGGEVRLRAKAAFGHHTIAMLRQFKVHKCFVSVGGISLTENITDYDIDEVHVAQTMVERAQEAVVLADHSKFGKTTFARVCDLRQVSIIVTDEQCPQEWEFLLEQQGIRLLRAGENPEFKGGDEA